ncbi:MAG: hypothetical protein M3011_12100 [Actinomycetota bacterium]|nr:hypothetical protein [Actinomycetota bacterium]
MKRLVRTGAATWLTLVAVVGAMGLAGCAKDNAAKDGTVLVPGPGQEFVTGDVAHFLADDAQSSKPLASPFTLMAAERGEASATIENALVDGSRSTISWPSGTPLPITGPGGLELGPIHVDVDPTGVTWALDGGARSFVPGTYVAGASVAVGTGGLAASRDSVEFRADERTVLTSRGGVTVHVDPESLELTGPGKTSVSGNLRVQGPDSTRRASAVTFGPGPFKVTLAPGGSTGVSINAVLQGKATAS